MKRDTRAYDTSLRNTHERQVHKKTASQCCSCHSPASCQDTRCRYSCKHEDPYASPSPRGVQTDTSSSRGSISWSMGAPADGNVSGDTSTTRFFASSRQPLRCNKGLQHTKLTAERCSIRGKTKEVMRCGESRGSKTTSHASCREAPLPPTANPPSCSRCESRRSCTPMARRQDRHRPPFLSYIAMPPRETT